MENIIPILKPSKNFLIVFDMGTTKISCTIAEYNKKNSNISKIIDILYSNSEGIRNGGKITNFNIIKNIIIALLKKAEKITKSIIDEVYINVANCGVQSYLLKTHLEVYGKKITKNDVINVIKQATLKSKDLISLILPIEYEVDSIKGITDPIEMCGDYLKCFINVVSLSKSETTNLEHCFNQYNIEVKGFISSGHTSAMACLGDSEKKLGVTIIDIGGESTSIATFINGENVFITSLPIGGIQITNDIACAFNIDILKAEEIKLKIQNLKTETISTLKDNISIDINLEELKNVINCRLEEILEIAKTKIQQDINLIVLTGGVSKTNDICKIAKLVFKKKTKIGYPTQGKISENFQNQPQFSAGIGSVYLLSKIFQNPLYQQNTNKIKKILNFLGL